MAPLESVLGILAVKACVAAVLALGAAAAGRFAKRPALVHALWLVVLFELLVPPLFNVGVLPRAALPARADPAPATATTRSATVPVGDSSPATLPTIEAAELQRHIEKLRDRLEEEAPGPDF